MPPKRKRVSETIQQPTKRAKAVATETLDSDEPESQHEEEELLLDQNVLDEGYWPVRRIAAERGNKYLIDWEDDPDGTKHPKTWEPKEFATEAAVLEWEATKPNRSGRGRPRKSIPRARKSIASPVAGPSSTSKKKAGTYRKSRIVESSSAPEVGASQDALVQEQDQEGLGLIFEADVANNEQERADDSYAEPVQDQGLVSEQLLQEFQETSTPLSPPTRREVEVRISPVRDRDDYEDFDSSQLITGTQPQQNSSQAPSQSQPPLIDAGAAPNLTQKHSQYDPGDTSKSTEDNTGSADVTSSSSVHISPATQQFESSAVIPDSQSLLDSTSYIPSGDKSEESSKDSDKTGSDPAAANPLPPSQVTTDSQAGPDTQIVPESSFLKTVNAGNADNETQEDSTTQSADIVEADQLEDHNDPIERSSVAEDVLDQHDPQSLEFPSPAAEGSLSSASSPPETESAEKSQSLSQSQTRPVTDQDWQLQTQTQFDHLQQPAQLVESIESSHAAGFGTAVSAAQSQPVGRTEDTLSQLIASIDPSYRVSSAPPEPPSSTLPRVSSGTSSRLARNRQASGLTIETGRRSIDQRNSNSQRPYRKIDWSRYNSSPPASVPSQFPVIIGESAPPRPELSSQSQLPATPSRGTPDRMDSSTPQSERSLRSTLSALHRERELRRAERNAASPRPPLAISTITPASAVPARLQSPAIDRDLRSPSVASVLPPNEVIPEEAPEDYTRSERFQTLLPEQSPQVNSNHEAGATRSTEVSTQSGSQDRNQHVLPIDMGEVQRDQYKQTITYYRDDIDNFLTQVWLQDSDVYGKAHSLVQQLRHIITHPDLINEETFTQVSYIEPYKKAQWDVDCSAKFRFLKALFDSAQVFNLNIAMIVKPGRLSDILQMFFQGSNISFIIAGQDDVFMDKPAATIFHLGSEQSLTTPPPDLILALDGTLSSEDISNSQATLSRAEEGNSLVPFFSLVIPKSVEHVERSMPPYSSEAQRLHVLVSTLVSLRNEAGRPQDGAPEMEAIAAGLVGSILNPDTWTAEALPEIHLMSPAVSSQNSTQGDTIESSLNHGTKRPFGDDLEDMPGAKKSRIVDNEIPSTINPQEMDISHVSESISSQPLPDIYALQTRLQEHIAALEKLQFENEEQRSRLFETQGELEQAQRVAAAAKKRAETLAETNTNLRTQVAALRTEVSNAKASLLTHDNPENRSNAILQAELDASIAELAKQARASKSHSDELDYVRSNYQTASNRASTLAQENKDLAAQNVTLERDASGQRTLAREMALSAQTQAWTQEKKRLVLELQNKNAMLQRNAEEIVKLKEGRGRMGTRATSVPRSPRVGSRPSSPAAAAKPSRLRVVDG